MKQVKSILFFWFFLICYLSFAQGQSNSFQLNWIEGVDFELNTSNEIKVDLVENNFLDDNLNPVYSNSWEISNELSLVDFSIENVVTETISKENFGKFNLKEISSEVVANFNFTNQRTKRLAILSLTPLIYDGNVLKRIISFDISYQTSTNQSKSSEKSSVKNSVLASGEWFKFTIDTTGVFKISKSFLQSLGMDLSGVNPKNIQIYGNGGEMLPFLNSEPRYDGLQENAIYINGEDDGSFDNNDYILFYGRGPNKWINNNNNLETLVHEYNIFSDEAYYFITVGSNEGLRVQNRLPISESAIEQINNFDDYTFIEEDEVNLFAAGQQWFGDSFSIENTRTYNIPFNNIDTATDIIVRARGVAESSLSSSMSVKVNGQNSFNLNFSAISGLTHASANENGSSLSLSGNNVSVEITYNNNGNPSANAYLDYIEVLGMKQLTADGSQFSFRNFNVMNSSGVFEFVISNASNVSAVWDVTNPLNPTNVINESSSTDFSFKLKGGDTHEFIVLNDSDYYTPEKADDSRVENQNLHSLTNLDYIIVTRDYLMNQAQKIADYHIEYSNLKVQVIDLDQIYNEFSSGSPDLTAIRDFAKHLYDNSTSNKLKFICLFGDGSYDYKDRISGNNNVVPVFEAYNSFNMATSYVTDDYYGMMDEGEGSLSSSDRQDVATGRIPVTTSLEASEVVNKILDYYSPEAFGDWRTKITLVADDIDANGEEVLEVGLEKLADTIAENQPLFNLKKIYIDAYVQESSSGGQRYPVVNVDLQNEVEKGTLLIDYFGHGGENGWASERILEISEIQDMKNGEKLPLYVTITCEFSRFDNPLRSSGGEYLIWNPIGGAASSISTTREVYISVGESVNAELIKPLLNFYDDNYTISEALMHTKNLFTTSQRFFIYSFGDPAMKLHVPKPNVVITKMNDIPVTQSLDTIKALSYIKFEGEVTDDSGSIINDFNGEFEVTVYDKPIENKTLDNDDHNFVMLFESIESKIFTGRSKVENGIFSFDFIAPKDLKIAYGKGKLSFYATNNAIDRAGYNFDVVVGGINEDAPEDNIGPTVQLYMNDLSFVDGGNTNESPVFIAILEDESGINTSITAVDHDIIAILDGDQSNSIILNDYYETELDNYKKGKVSYPFRDLEPGLHTITLKVWDTYNNLSESTFTFFVVDDSDLVLSNVLNYPNPFINYTEFWFNHNKPNQLLKVQVQIYTVSGKLVKTINETIQSEGSLSRTISWNGLDDFGSKIGKGVYVYKLNVTTEGGINAQKIEKLVILQ